MAKKKTPSLADDLALAKIPFNLFSGFTLLAEELKSKNFVYQKIVISSQANAVLDFISKKTKEKITVSINKDNLLIKQFSEENNHEKLKVLYVITPSQRNFKLL